MLFNVSDTIAAAQKEYGLNSGASFKVKEGNNKIRLLSEAIPHQSFYKGNKTLKFVSWVLDYSDKGEEKDGVFSRPFGTVKLYFMPMTVLKSIEALQRSDDYPFTEVPMPYDITINAKNAGTKEVEYQLMPARNASEVPSAAVEQMNGKAPLREVLAKLTENQKSNPDNQPPADDGLDSLVQGN